MRQHDPLDGLPVFLAVAELRSFSAAARRFGISVSAASQAVRRLETRVGTPLLRRSTRSIALTELGTDYAGRAGPAWRELLLATGDLAMQAGKPSGPLRLTMPRSAFDSIVGPMLVGFQAACPAVEIEISVEGKLVDLVEQDFDAGLRYGDVLASGVTAMKLQAAGGAILAAAPAYLSERITPGSPVDLLEHHAVMCRSPSSGIVRSWRLERHGESMLIVPTRRTIVGDLTSQLALMARGAGIGLVAIGSMAGPLEAGILARVLPEWMVPMQPLYIYYPDRQHRSGALRAFIEYLRQNSTMHGNDHLLGSARQMAG